MDTPLTFVNDDLVGFFNSVPQERLLDAVSALLQEWRQQRSEFVISVDIFGTGRPTQTTFSRHHRRPAFHHKSIYTEVFLEIIQCSLPSHSLQALGQVWRQIRGAGIGLHISPFCNIAIALIEQSWQTTYAQFLAQPSVRWKAFRYVDNRFSIYPEQFEAETVIQVFKDLAFYTLPVELET